MAIKGEYKGRINKKKADKGHKNMVVWQSIDELDMIVQKLLKNIPSNEYRLRSQIDSASDSIGANFVEGYYSGFLPEYIRFLTYSRRSLGELQERVRRVLRKGYLKEDEYGNFDERASKTMFLLNRLIYSLKKKRKDQKG